MPKLPYTNQMDLKKHRHGFRFSDRQNKPFMKLVMKHGSKQRAMDEILAYWIENKKQEENR